MPPAATNGAAAACCGAGPGYATPLAAKESGPRETLIYVPCIVPDASRPDYLATGDVDPASATYGQVRARQRAGGRLLGAGRPAAAARRNLMSCRAPCPAAS